MLTDKSQIQHDYIVGQTGSGKSYIAKQIAKEFRWDGWPIFVSSAKAARTQKNGDPLDDIKEWFRDVGAERVESDPYVLVDIWKRHEMPPSVVVFDEGTIDLGNHPDPRMKEFFALAREERIKIILLGLTYSSVNKTIRQQCGRLFLFNVPRQDLREIIGDWPLGTENEAIMQRAVDLPVYGHLHADRKKKFAAIIGPDGSVIS